MTPSRESYLHIACCTLEPVARRGGCNFCTRNTERMVWAVRSNDEHRHLEVRFCRSCMAEILQQVGRLSNTIQKGDPK